MNVIRAAATAGRALAAMVLAVALAVLSACYLPDEFKAEVRVAATGEYVLTYDGVLTWVPLYDDILSGRLRGAEAEQKILEMENDLRRDHSFRAVRSLGQGRYRVTYERTGQLDDSEMVTFVRRNANILSIKSLKSGTITVAAASVAPAKARELKHLGLPMRGLLRVTTALPVTQHNANKVGKSGAFSTYDWNVTENLRTGPKIILRRSPPPLTP